MKTELITAIGTAIVGTLVAYFACGFFIGEIKPVNVKTINSSVNTELKDPDSEVFNYKAINPTVEVYVGDCAEYNANGECIEQVTEEEIIDFETEVEDSTEAPAEDNQ